MLSHIQHAVHALKSCLSKKVYGTIKSIYVYQFQRINMSNTAGDGGKGSTPRPRFVADDEWATRWNAIFGKDKEDSYKQSVIVDNYQQNDKEEKDGLDIRSGDIS
jgi:hypothetical protein